MEISNGTVYEGGWVKGKKCGEGTEISKSFGIETRYVGEWKNNQKNGLGREVTVMNGVKSEYKGGWKNNRKYGFGEEMISGEDQSAGEGFNITSKRVNMGGKAGE